MATEYAKKIAEELIDQLRQGTAPWQKPWQPGEQFMPYNPTTGKDYRGGNTVWLLAQGYSDPRWMTYRQAAGEGAQVRRGEHGTQIQYWVMRGTEPVLDEQGRPVRGDDGKSMTRPVEYERPRVKTFTVFNGEQIDGLSPPPTRSVAEWERHQRAEAIIGGSGAVINHEAGDRAYYQLKPDKIVMPERGQFPTADGYYATLLHELGHWTGAPGRLDRDMAHPFGSEGYAREELRAEIASLMIGTEIGVGHDPLRHAAYVASWIEVLESDPHEVFRAATDAEKIAGMLRGFEQEQQREPDRSASASPSADDGTVVVRAPTLIREDHAIMQAGKERTYLAVPYAEKDQAKASGAKWDREAKSWYAPAGTDLAAFNAWIPPRDKLHIAPTLDPRAEFAEALRNAGLEMNGLPDMDGQLHRVRVIGDSGRRCSGAYVGHLDGHPAGYIQNFKTGLQTNWKSVEPMQALGAQDRARLTAEAAQRAHDRAIEREATSPAVALTVESAWAAAMPAPSDHPYLVAKGIEPGALRVGAPGQTIPTTDRFGRPKDLGLEGRLLVRMSDTQGKPWNLQTIDADGTKMFLKGGRVEGTHTIIGELKSERDPAIITEGYATGATIHRAIGQPVMVAFSAGNIAPVAQAYRDQHPERSVIIAGDNDHTKEADRNVGRRRSEEAAVAVAGFTLLPDFAPNDRGTDWNDYERTNGREATSAALRTGLNAIQAKQTAVEYQALRQERQNEEHEHELLEERQLQAHENEDVEMEFIERREEAERVQEQEQSLGVGR